MHEVDGSFGEGGGQVVRTSLSLSALTGTPVRIFNIRANRDPPGLKPQHLMAAKAVRSIARGTLEGAEEGSRELVYRPKGIIGGKYEFNIGTAGSTTLVAQTVLPLLLRAKKPSTVRITGGTHNPKAPTWDYFERVFLPALRLFGAKISATLLRAGYYPRGGGEIGLAVSPSALSPVGIWPRESIIKGMISVANLPLSIGLREKKIFIDSGIENVRIREEKALDPGNAVLLWRGFVGSALLGKKGVRAEEVAKECVQALEAEGDVDVDVHLADQLLIYAALAGKTSFKTSRISNHTATSAGIIGGFLEKEFSLEGATAKVD